MNLSFSNLITILFLELYFVCILFFWLLLNTICSYTICTICCVWVLGRSKWLELLEDFLLRLATAKCVSKLLEVTQSWMDDLQGCKSRGDTSPQYLTSTPPPNNFRKKKVTKQIWMKWLEKHEFGYAKIQNKKISFTDAAQKFSQIKYLKIIPPISKKSPKYADHPPKYWTRICNPDNLEGLLSVSNSKNVRNCSEILLKDVRIESTPSPRTFGVRVHLYILSLILCHSTSIDFMLRSLPLIAAVHGVMLSYSEV